MKVNYSLILIEESYLLGIDHNNICYPLSFTEMRALENYLKLGAADLFLFFFLKKWMIEITIILHISFAFNCTSAVSVSLWQKQWLPIYDFPIPSFNKCLISKTSNEIMPVYKYSCKSATGCVVVYVQVHHCIMVIYNGKVKITFLLTFSRRKSLSYRNQSIDLHSKSMDWFLYDRNLRHKRVKGGDLKRRKLNLKVNVAFCK